MRGMKTSRRCFHLNATGAERTAVGTVGDGYIIFKDNFCNEFRPKPFDIDIKNILLYGQYDIW